MFQGFNSDTHYLMCDPPSGWKYGFPKVYDFVGSGDPVTYDAEVEEWFLGNGYPQREIDAGMLKHVRFWDVPRHPVPTPEVSPLPTNVVEFPKK